MAIGLTWEASAMRTNPLTIRYKTRIVLGKMQKKRYLADILVLLCEQLILILTHKVLMHAWSYLDCFIGCLNKNELYHKAFSTFFLILELFQTYF